MFSRLTSSASVLALTTALACFSSASTANAAFQVYPGCAAPSSTSNHTWYIDPVNGSTTGDGSQAHPWNSLQAVFVFNAPPARPLLSTVPWFHRDSAGKTSTDNSSAPIKPGDKILLMSGNYGAITIGYNSRYPVANSDFVTIEAAPGQTPVLTNLVVNAGVTKLLFSGLTIEGERINNDWKSRVSLVGSDIILTNSHVMTAPDLSNWTRDQWMHKAAWVGVSANGTCASFTNNVIENVVYGALFSSSPNILFANNTVRNWSWDAIQATGTTSNVLISHNNFVDHVGVNDFGPDGGYHSDVLQIFGLKQTNIVIDGNYVNEKTSANVPWPGREINLPSTLQGFDNFGDLGPLSGVVVSNNVVITSSPNGIVFSSPGVQIINNTVLSGVATTGGGTWIQATGAGSVIRNNIATNIIAPVAGVTVDHNIVNNTLAVLVGTNPNPWHSVRSSAGRVIGDHNTFDTNAFADVFVKYDPTHFLYDLNLRVPVFTATQSGSDDPALGAGNASGMPEHDITGAVRTLPADLGAYTHVAPKK